MNYRTLTIAVTLTLAAAGGIASAQDTGMLALVDKDGDGNVSAAEMAANAKTQFAEADTDKNGALSEAEFVAFRQKFFKQLDTNDDGVITHAEMRTRFLARAFH
jgi:Ca2+-binding EF-hand superfamily protein